MRQIIDKSGVTVIGDGGEYIMISASDPAFPLVRDYLIDGGRDITRVHQLAHAGKAEIRQVTADVRDAVDGDCETPYRISHGDPVDAVVLAAAVRVRREGGDLAAFGAFTRRLEANPSAASRSQLFAWLAAGGFTLTPDGMIVGYKGVSAEGRSLCSGREHVTITHQDGTVESVLGYVPYPVGATVSMARELVDEDRDQSCAAGLHVGTYSYATGFGSATILVFVDPADVVAVPRDHRGEKMRVCKLFVAARHDGEQISDAILATVRTIPDHDAATAYRDRPENHSATSDADEYDDGLCWHG
ncbi:hypothetical protein ACWIGI_34590 [Nocardia sp. NPDC055321]